MDNGLDVQYSYKNYLYPGPFSLSNITLVCCWKSVHEECIKFIIYWCTYYEFAMDDSRSLT